MSPARGWRFRSDSFFDQAIRNIPRDQKIVGESEFWREDDPVIDADGRITVGGMWPHQREVWNLPNFCKILVGGYGSGKTSLSCKRIISMALDNFPCPVAIVSPTFSMARRTVVPQISEYLQMKQALYGRKFWWRYNSGTHEFMFHHENRDCTVHVLSGERPLLLRGPNLGAAIIDEPFIQDEEVFKQMIARVRHPEAPCKEMMLTGTPEGGLGWGYDLCVGEQNSTLDVGVVFASTRANKALDEGYVKRLESVLSERACQAYIEGRFVNLAEGLVYYAFDPMDHVVDVPIPLGAQLGAGMDFNVSPMAFCVFWVRGDHMHFFEEYEIPNADTEYACSVLKENHWDQGLREIFPDATGSERSTKSPGGKSDFHFIRDAGFDIRCRSRNPERKDRYNAVNGKLRSRDGKVTLTVSPKCKKLIKYMATYSHDLMNKQENLGHLLDSLSYPCSYLFPRDRDSLKVQMMKGY